MLKSNVEIVVATGVVPTWARGESETVRHLIALNRLTQPALKALRAFAANAAGVDQPMVLSYSLARALANRVLGEVEGRGVEKLGALSRHLPKSRFRLNLAGQKLAVALAEGAPGAGGEASPAGAE